MPKLSYIHNFSKHEPIVKTLSLVMNLKKNINAKDPVASQTRLDVSFD